MKNFIYRSFTLASLFLTLLVLPVQTFSMDNGLLDNSIFLVTQGKTIINYERSQPSSIDNPVVDPNFNVMRSSDTESSLATYIVVGLLIAATIIPLATWWYFSK